jgi:phosphatidylserine/phosphatidylglycerophosphate/cardiolipin synthase-like enzyme
MKKYCYGLVFLVFIILLILLLSYNQKAEATTNSFLVINEVMYDPLENDNYFEWIELYNPTVQFIDVENWSIYDGQQMDTLEGNTDQGNGSTVIPPNGYALITDHGTQLYDLYNISNTTILLYVDDSALCGYGLNNEQEKLILMDAFGIINDMVEWGFDFEDVEGYPADDVNEGNSLARYKEMDENNSFINFYYGITPTPGAENQVDILLEQCPLYVPKITNGEEYSLPFSFLIAIHSSSLQGSYDVKSYIVGNYTSIWPATQTWQITQWKYSNYYTSTIQVNNSEQCFLRQILRFNNNYNEYQQNIRNNTYGYLIVKLKQENCTYRVIQKLNLVDLDESTANGAIGGYIVGRMYHQQEYVNNAKVIVKNKTGVLVSHYITEDNGIDEGLRSIAGYYKLSSPVGTDYSVTFYSNKSLVHTMKNITVERGNYFHSVHSPKQKYELKKNQHLIVPLCIKNIGDFPDCLTISLSGVPEYWNVWCEKERVWLNPQEMAYIQIYIYQDGKSNVSSSTLTITTTSRYDPGIINNHDLCIDILAPDLTLLSCICYDAHKRISTRFGEGEIVTVKTKLKNQGTLNATNVDVSFYYDTIDDKHLIGTKQYASVGSYPKYPSIGWDTKSMSKGDHTLLIYVDEKNNVYEFDESNNLFTFTIQIFNTDPKEISKYIVISEIYYDCHANLHNEYIVLYNPSQNASNVSGWCLTNKPQYPLDLSTNIFFPEQTFLLPYSTLVVTQNASDYFQETGKLPDFEYHDNSRDSVPQMIADKTFTLSNVGGSIAIKDTYNHTIDLVVYGEEDFESPAWNGPSIPKSGKGIILKRNRNRRGLQDTNTSKDWNHTRIFGIGQSAFPYLLLNCSGTITTFVSPDCSFETIVQELRNATESIYFNIYEFTDPFLCNELVNALHRNVSLKVFLEGAPIGGIDDREIFIVNKITNNGGDVRFIVNDPEKNVYDRYRFDHAKYLIIDNHTVIVESCNWVKTGIPKDPSFGNREWGIIVRNQEVAQYFIQVFNDDWNPMRADSYSFDDMNLSLPPEFYMSETIYAGRYRPTFYPQTVQEKFRAIPVFSPDTSQEAIMEMIDSAQENIYIQQLYIYRDWKNGRSPFVEQLVHKAQEGIEVKVILNYNPSFEPTNIKQNETREYLEKNGVKVKFLYTNWSYFTNLHNKGMIVDNTSVLISSINWNENSVRSNREAGVIIINEQVATYYSEVFFFDWNLTEFSAEASSFSLTDFKNPFLIFLVYAVTFSLVARDWRKRKWT